MADIRTKEDEREQLHRLISEWNASRLDIFEISEPNEDLEFRGVMRFFFQDSGSKVATKCIRVSSSETTTDVTNTLVEKFRPDMKMLSQAKYALYEVHPNGGTRALASHEKPLLVQLAWLEDDREGRFLLKSDQDKVNTVNLFATEPNQNFKRKLSKREKKQLKKQKEEELKRGKENKAADDTAIAKGLYEELPETSFTRSISNPEAVMRRRRQQKLEKRLRDFQSQDGGQDSGGTLKIFATTLKPEIPYKTLLVAMHASATQVVKDALEKYQMEKEDPDEYCLVMVNIPPEGPNGANTLGKERVVPDQDCPLGIAASWPANLGTVVFHLRRRANLPKYRREKRERRSKSPSRVPFSPTSDHAIGERLAAPSFPEHLLPYLIELGPDGQNLNRNPQVHRLHTGVTEVGSDRSSGPFIQLFAPQIRARHCVITNIDGVVSIVPSSSDAETFVDGRRIYETTKLGHGKVVKFGRSHVFRFSDPAFDQRAKPQAPSLSDRGSDQASISSISDSDVQKKGRRDYEVPDDVDMESGEAGVFETTFDVTGEIKTNTTFPEREKQLPNLQAVHSFEDLQQDSADGDKLPARLEFREVGEDAFFAVVISEVNGAAVHFKLSPTYTLYMCCRYRMSPAYRPDLTTDQRGERLGVTLVKMGNIVRSTVRENSQMPASLAFWIANASELLHFLKRDRDIFQHSRDGQQILTSSIQMAFRSLVHCVQQELKSFMSAFLDDTDDADMADMDFDAMSDPDSPEHAMTANERSFRFAPSGRPLGSDQWLGARRRHPKPTISDVLYTLSSAMSLLRRCRVNAAVTIQVFTHLFHYINMWIFNKLVLQPHHGLCSRAWGRKLRKRLARVESWAQKQGLELAADRHLSRIIQAAHLLQAPKNSHSDINAISSTCFKLNSYQLRALLENYVPSLDEPAIPAELIDSVVGVAENTADELMRSNGQEVQLEEEPELNLPFLLPEDGYSCEVIRGVPPGLREFLEPLASTGLCKLIVQPMASGLWTVYQTIPRENGGEAPKASSPDFVEVAFNKGRGGMGLSIVAAKGAGQDQPGIYVKQVVKDGPAARDGRLQAGDQLVSVNGESLIGVSQERAAELMVKSGANVTLLVAKQGAIFHGLATLLSQPSPMVTREVTGKLTPVEPESAQVVQASPTVPEDQLQRPPTRWLQNDAADMSYRQRNARADEADRRRAEEEEKRRAAEEEKQRQLEDERRRAEEDERRREEARKLEEERRFAEERRKADEERRYAEETQRIEGMRNERRAYNDWRGPQSDDRRRSEEPARPIGQSRFHGDMERPPIKPKPKPKPAQFQEGVRNNRDVQRSPTAFTFENANREPGLRTSPPAAGSPRSYSPNGESHQFPEEPSSPLRIDTRETKYGRAIAVRPSGMRSPTQRPTDLDQYAQAEAWRRNDQSEFDRWQREEQQLAEKREREMEERERLERERREQEERAWREKLDRERALQEEREKWERERLNRERLEREKQEERDRQALQAMLEEQRRQEQLERERREREERERQEKERVIRPRENQNVHASPARDQEPPAPRALEQQRWKSSKDMLDSIESMNPDEVEQEFQRRLQEEKRRDDIGQQRTAGGLVSVTRVQYHPPDREEQMERERKIQLILDERERRERERKENDRRRKLQEEQEERERQERQQRRLQQFELERDQQREAQKKLQEQREREQAEWLRQQKEKREQQRAEQERQRAEHKMREEEERNRKRQELLQRKEQEDALRRQSQQQKEDEERRFAEEQRQIELRREQDRRRQYDEQRLLREKEENVRRQQMDDERARKVSTEDHVNELKQRAFADYDRRRQLIDDEVDRRRDDKPASVLKNSNSMKPRKQVSFSNVATEIREPSSPTYVVGNSAGYTARVTPAASVRYVHTRLPSDSTSPTGRFPPADDDDEDDLPPPPPPPPPEELLKEDSFPPPPPPKSSHSLQRFSAIGRGGGNPPGGYYPPAYDPQRNHGDGYQPSPYNSSEVQYRNIPVSSTGGYPSYITLPRKGRPLSYPAALDASPAPPPQRYGSQENVLDGPAPAPTQQTGRPRFQPPQAARLDSDEEDLVGGARVSLARVSLTDEEKTRSPAKPEKMDFRDKLKMFNASSPEDRARLSKWERSQLTQMNGD